MSVAGRRRAAPRRARHGHDRQHRGPRRRSCPTRSSMTSSTSLRDVDARFSTYRPDSEISRLMSGRAPRGGLPASTSATSSPPATTWPTATGGAFDARRRRRRRRASIRPATSRAGRSRRPPGCSTRPARRNYWINAGGDIVARGHGGDRPAVARRDPPPGPGRSRGRRPGGLRPGRGDLGRLRARRRTSPTRGPGRAATGLRSVTVVGPAARLHRRLRDRRLRRWVSTA